MVTNRKYKPCSKYCKMQDVKCADGTIIHCTDCNHCTHKNECMTAQVTQKTLRTFNKITRDIV